MGSWLTAISQGAGRFGSELGQSTDYNLELGLKAIQNQLMQQQIKEGQQRVQLEEQRLKQSQTPQEQLINTPQGGTSAIPYDPTTGKFGDPRTLVAGAPPPPKGTDQELAEAIEKGDFAKANKIIGMQADRYKAEHPETKLPGPEEQLKVAQQIAQSEGLTPGSKKYNDRVLDIYKPAAAKIVVGGGAGAGGGVEASDIPSLAEDVKNRAMTFAQLRTFGKNVPRQVEEYMRKNGIPVPPQMNSTTVDKLEQREAALTNAITLIDSIQQNSDLLGSLGNASLVNLSESPGSISRLAHFFTSDADKDRIDQLAADARSLKEAINVIRTPLGATGFRGKEGWTALQAQTLQALASPGVNARVLSNTKRLLQGLMTATDTVLNGSAPQPSFNVPQPMGPPQVNTPPPGATVRDYTQIK